MLKKMGFVAASAAAGMLLLGGVASASESHHYRGGDDDHQVGLVNVNNLDALHNVNATVGFCHNNVNVLGVQVPVQDSANGIGVPILSPGHNGAAGENPDNCASGGVEDGGTSQDN
ncbi:hypothetical protein LWP59_02285 [Amycolatopsis acidiphila]|uniref:Chaplin n=1 Tax=Amycolatopsis acidiphila TaxID=715473 RepID=A0A557ZPC1_9PSEU|nr:hypothetical protein [Amycolatopsis acidiphila]TVT13866.1 hypothetical protein FNH06_38540 [Amycolatopsis acidiphila]UIJ60540.1 hypothetical protein LWP59_02285 [Amycolatopsis acidiphila]GHG82270.1 hypothetical protein GCM10017788_52690 [Amycolatopsis acidiphila]